MVINRNFRRVLYTRLIRDSGHFSGAGQSLSPNSRGVDKNTQLTLKVYPPIFVGVEKIRPTNDMNTAIWQLQPHLTPPSRSTSTSFWAVASSRCNMGSELLMKGKAGCRCGKSPRRLGTNCRMDGFGGVKFFFRFVNDSPENEFESPGIKQGEHFQKEMYI